MVLYLPVVKMVDAWSLRQRPSPGGRGSDVMDAQHRSLRSALGVLAPLVRTDVVAGAKRARVAEVVEVHADRGSGVDRGGVGPKSEVASPPSSWINQPGIRPHVTGARSVSGGARAAVPAEQEVVGELNAL